MIIFNVFSGPVPADESRIWRYVDFFGFVALLQKRQLFFANPESFEDPFEGTIPPAIAALYAEKDPSKQQVGGSEKLWKVAMALRHEREKAGVSEVRYFLNCWHMNEVESAAMWKLYGQSAGVAVQSTKGRLMRAFNPDSSSVSIAPVTYFDYALDDLTSILPPAGGGLPEDYKLMITPTLLFKRKSFEHERELRAMTWDSKDCVTENDGKYVPVDLEVLVERVYVSPLLPAWVAGVVSHEMKQHGLTQDVVHSTLYSKRLA